jgi:hypothetical protein
MSKNIEKELTKSIGSKLNQRDDLEQEIESLKKCLETVMRKIETLEKIQKK